MNQEKWLNGNQLSLDIWSKKYRNGTESFEEWLDRVSGGNEDVRQLIKDKKFLFGGRVLAGRNIGKPLSLSNCYVLEPPEDNLESIFDTAAKMARTFSKGGGVGIDISKLAPKGAVVNNAANYSSGAVSFMDFYSHVTGLISQSGRRGATMISIDCTHPDLEDFINLKQTPGVCEKANISVRVSDAFMKAVINDADWELSFTRPESNQTIKKVVKAKKIMELLALRNWEMAEPGILFWDTITHYNLLDNTSFKYAGVNPCGEEPLPSYGACSLSSINLSEFVISPFTKDATIDWPNLAKAMRTAVKAQNQVLTDGINLHPLKEQSDCAKGWRQIGIGTMGLADMLIKLGITYGSPESIRVISRVYRELAVNAVLESLELAKLYGHYPNCESTEKLSKSSFIQALNLSQDVLDDIAKYGLFNSQLLTCAPTGSTATMLGVSTGVEPNFAFTYTRRTQSLHGEDTYYQVEADIVKQYREATGNTGKLPEYFVASQDIKPIDRIDVQSALQQYIDASISSTLNLPESATVEDVFNIYVDAWKYGLKGITIYRDNCQRQGILTTEPKKVESKETSPELKRGEIIKSGENCTGLKRTLNTGCGSLHCEAFFDPNTGEFREIYLSKGSTGGCNNFMIGLSRMISVAARGGVGIDDILDQLKSCGVCPSYAVRKATKNDVSPGSCCPVAVGNALKSMYKEIQEILCKCNELPASKIETAEEPTDLPMSECPSCHKKTLTRQGGCTQCLNCGYSKCD